MARLANLRGSINAEFRQWSPVKKRKAGLASGLRGDKVYTPSPRRSEGRRDQLGALSEPRR